MTLRSIYSLLGAVALVAACSSESPNAAADDAAMGKDSRLAKGDLGNSFDSANDHAAQNAGDGAALPDGVSPDGALPDALVADMAQNKVNCSPAPSCNWCGGQTILDANGCIDGYKCANGADPCTTQPCQASNPASCKSDEYCGKDLLCWKKSSAPSTFACGTEIRCALASQFCATSTRQPFSVPASGVCGKNCKQAGALCYCRVYSCLKLNTCRDCACLTPQYPGCKCGGTDSGGFTIDCG
ncbi:MAG: hypothetical protein H6707_09195 [Deltaproteobacteria bacterium]|nr:hypothetical protein [Deltaproteobacteria bacterium]